MKSSSVDELVRAIEHVLDGGKYVSQAFAGRFAESFNWTKEKPHESLSPREFEVLLRIARGARPRRLRRSFRLASRR